MKFKELYDGHVNLFSGIFKQRQPELYDTIFGDLDADLYADLQYGEREVRDSLTPENVVDGSGVLIDLMADNIRDRWNVFSKEYDFLSPVLSKRTASNTVTVSEQNTDGTVKSDKTFSDEDFVNDSKQDVTRDKARTENETSDSTVTGLSGNISEAMMKEYKVRLMNLRMEIIREVVSAITLEIYV